MSTESEELRALSFVRRSLLKKQEKIREMNIKIRTLQDENSELKWKCSDQEKEIERLNAVLGLNTQSFQSSEEFDGRHGDNMLNNDHEDTINDISHAVHGSICSDNETSLEGSSGQFHKIKQEVVKEGEGSLSSNHNTAEEAFVESPELGNGFSDTLPGCRIENSMASRTNFSLPSQTTMDMQQGSSSNAPVDSQEASLLLAEHVLAEQFVAENSDISGPSSAKRLRGLDSSRNGRHPNPPPQPLQSSSTRPSGSSWVQRWRSKQPSPPTAAHLKPRQCPYCGVTKERWVNHEFARHLRSHTGERFGCPCCSYASVDKRDLKKHVRRMHPTHALLPCPAAAPDCSLTFVFAHDAAAHARKFHSFMPRLPGGAGAGVQGDP